MIDMSWQIDHDDWDPDVVGAPRPLLGTWHFIRAALRRERRTWVGLALVGGLLGVAAVLLSPPSSTSTVSVMLAHKPATDPTDAITTDISLLTTRAVASDVVDTLGLGMTPEAFQQTVTAVPVTDQILQITVAAPTQEAADARTTALLNEFLAFRTTQMQSLDEGLVKESQARISDLERQVEDLNRQYDQIGGTGAKAQADAADILTRRTQIENEITSLQRGIEQATLATSAAISSTHVLDAVRAVPSSQRKAVVLSVASGVIGGLAVGVGFVVLRALTSDKLRRREEVALALGAPVRFSVPSPGPPSSPLGWMVRAVRGLLPGRATQKQGAWRPTDLETLVAGLESTLDRSAGGRERALRTSDRAVAPWPGRSGRSGTDRKSASAGPQVSEASNAGRSASGGPSVGLALAAIGNASAAAVLVKTLADRLGRRGLAVLTVDLTESGSLVASRSAGMAENATPWAPQAVGAAGPDTWRRDVYRPRGVPMLAKGPRGTDPDLQGALLRAKWAAADVVLVVTDLDPGIDVENLTSWVDQVVPLVSAGRSTAELLETSAGLVRAAGLTLPFAMMLGSDATDESSGLVPEPDSGASSEARG
jgi:capsular polysaccharide biosynthesis protein